MFAAGGRYDGLIKEHRPRIGSRFEERHAVGFSLNWEKHLAKPVPKITGKAFLKKAVEDEGQGIFAAKRVRSPPFRVISRQLSQSLTLLANPAVRRPRSQLRPVGPALLGNRTRPDPLGARHLGGAGARRAVARGSALELPRRRVVQLDRHHQAGQPAQDQDTGRAQGRRRGYPRQGAAQLAQVGDPRARVPLRAPAARAAAQHGGGAAFRFCGRAALGGRRRRRRRGD